MANDTKRTPERADAFLEALSETGNVTHSMRVAGLTRTTLYAWRREDAEFGRRFTEAKTIGRESLEDEAYRRAHDGCDEPIFHNGQPCGEWVIDGKTRTADGAEVTRATPGAQFRQYGVRKYSDTLLIFLMKAHWPEKYRERFEHSGPNGGPIPIQDATPVVDVARRVAFILAQGQQALKTQQPGEQG